MLIITNERCPEQLLRHVAEMCGSGTTSSHFVWALWRQKQLHTCAPVQGGAEKKTEAPRTMSSNHELAVNAFLQKHVTTGVRTDRLTISDLLSIFRSEWVDLPNIRLKEFGELIRKLASFEYTKKGVIIRQKLVDVAVLDAIKDTKIAYEQMDILSLNGIPIEKNSGLVPIRIVMDEFCENKNRSNQHVQNFKVAHAGADFKSCFWSSKGGKAALSAPIAKVKAYLEEVPANARDVVKSPRVFETLDALSAIFERRSVHQVDEVAATAEQTTTTTTGVEEMERSAEATLRVEAVEATTVDDVARTRVQDVDSRATDDTTTLEYRRANPIKYSQIDMCYLDLSKMIGLPAGFKVRVDRHTKLIDVLDAVSIALPSRDAARQALKAWISTDGNNAVFWIRWRGTGGHANVVAPATTILEILVSIPSKSCSSIRKAIVMDACRKISGDLSLAVEVIEQHARVHGSFEQSICMRAIGRNVEDMCHNATDLMHAVGTAPAECPEETSIASSLDQYMKSARTHTPSTDGWIYVMTSSMYTENGIVKVGFTLRGKTSKAATRILETRYKTYLPDPHVAYIRRFQNAREAERQTFAILKKRRYARELFRCDVADAIAAIKAVSRGESCARVDETMCVEAGEQTIESTTGAKAAEKTVDSQTGGKDAEKTTEETTSSATMDVDSGFVNDIREVTDDYVKMEMILIKRFCENPADKKRSRDRLNDYIDAMRKHKIVKAEMEAKQAEMEAKQAELQMRRESIKLHVDRVNMVSTFDDVASKLQLHTDTRVFLKRSVTNIMSNAIQSEILASSDAIPNGAPVMGVFA